MQTIQTPSLGGCPMPARRRYAVRTALVLAAATAVVPLAATAASAERITPLPAPTQADPDRTRIYTPPAPKPTIVITTVQPGGGIATQVPPVLVACQPPNDCTPPADDPVGPADEANPTPGPVDPDVDDTDTTDPVDPADDGADTGGSDEGSAPGSDDADTGASAPDSTGVDPTLAPDLGTAGDTVDASGPDGTAEGYAEHGQSPADPVEAPPYTLIAGLGLLGAGLVGLVAMAILRRPQA